VENSTVRVSLDLQFTDVEHTSSGEVSRSPALDCVATPGSNDSTDRLETVAWCRSWSGAPGSLHRQPGARLRRIV